MSNDRLQEKLHLCRNMRRFQNNTIENLLDDLEKAEERIAELEDENEELRFTMSGLQEYKNKLYREVQELETDVALLESELDSCRNNNGPSL